MTAIAACRTCGTEPLENARFCHGCGSPVVRTLEYVREGDTLVVYSTRYHRTIVSDETCGEGRWRVDA